MSPSAGSGVFCKFRISRALVVCTNVWGKEEKSDRRQPDPHDRLVIIPSPSKTLPDYDFSPHPLRAPLGSEKDCSLAAGSRGRLGVVGGGLPGGGASRVLGWGEARRVEIVSGWHILLLVLLNSPSHSFLSPRQESLALGAPAQNPGAAPTASATWHLRTQPLSCRSSGPGHIMPTLPRTSSSWGFRAFLPTPSPPRNAPVT